MAIKLQTEKPSIPVVIGKLEFEFDVSDENIFNFRKRAADMSEEIQGIEESEDESEKLEQMKGIMRRGYDLMLEEGAFDQIYEQTPSVMRLLNYFMQLVEAIEKELNSMGLSESQQEKVQKYLKQKNKKK